MGMIRVVVAESHRWVRQGIKDILECSGDIVVLAEAEGAAQLLRHVEQLRPDVAVLDLNLRGMMDYDTIRSVREASPSTRILVLTSNELGDDQRATGLRVEGWLPKTCELADMQGAVRDIHHGLSANRGIQFRYTAVDSS